MTDITIHAGDNRTTLRELIDQGVRVHSVVTDPPYGLVSVQKRFSKPGSAAARAEGNDGSFARLSGGFMGKAWDGTGIERDPDFWRLIHDILLPGGYVFAFSGSRTGHWQACAMEMAGFVMHPLHGWIFSTGFPKAHNASKAIDKMLGAERETVGVVNRTGKASGTYGAFSGPSPVTTPGPDEAAEWEGWAYGTQAQKPALEPIYLGQKPFSEKTGAANLLKHGVGAVNIDGCRVSSEGGRRREGEASQDRRYDNKGATNFAAKPGPRGGCPSGRHPANLILDGSPEVVAMFPESKGQLAASKGDGEGRKTANCYGDMGHNAPVMEPRNDSGSAARFFHQFPPDTDPLFYHPKAGKLDRGGSVHPTVKPIALMQYLIRHITPPGGVVLDPFAGSGTTGEAARREGFDCILMEAEPEYVDFLRERFDILSEMATDEMDIFG